MLTSSKLEQVADDLIARQQRLFVVEASAGGALQAAISAPAGASRWLLGGLNCYHDSIKTGVLGLPAQVLLDSGAVSQRSSEELARCGLRLSAADWVLAESGVYGPGGGSPEKPVGLVYISVAGAGGCETFMHRLCGDRASLRRQVAQAAIEHLWQVLQA